MRTTLGDAKSRGLYLANRVERAGSCECGAPMALETYRDPIDAEPRHFLICDDCGRVDDQNELTVSDDEEHRALFIADHHARRGCGYCADLLRAYKRTSSDQDLLSLWAHVTTHFYEEDEDAE